MLTPGFRSGFLTRLVLTEVLILVIAWAGAISRVHAEGDGAWVILSRPVNGATVQQTRRVSSSSRLYRVNTLRQSVRTPGSQGLVINQQLASSAGISHNGAVQHRLLVQPQYYNEYGGNSSLYTRGDYNYAPRIQNRAVQNPVPAVFSQGNPNLGRSYPNFNNQGFGYPNQQTGNLAFAGNGFNRTGVPASGNIPVSSGFGNAVPTGFANASGFAGNYAPPRGFAGGGGFAGGFGGGFAGGGFGGGCRR